MNELHLSIVIPAFNEQERLPSTLKEIVAYLSRRPGASEIIVVDDGSSDATAAVAAECLRPLGERGRVLRQDVNRGKGASVQRGMLAARGELVLFSDADLSTPIEELETLEAAVAAGAHVAIGSRAIDRTLIERRQRLGREVSGRVFNWLVRRVLLGGIRDTQCGFKLFARNCVQPIFTRQRIVRFGFDVEVLAIARALGFVIAERPVRWRNHPDSRVDFSGGLLAFLDPLRVRVWLRLGRYDEPCTNLPEGTMQSDLFKRGLP